MSEHAKTRSARGLDVLRTLSGSAEAAQGMAAFFESRGAIGQIALQVGAGEVWARTALARRDRSLAVISMLAALNMTHELEFHLQGALNHGVTRTEIEEMLLTLVVYGGFPRAIDGMNVARRVFERAS